MSKSTPLPLLEATARARRLLLAMSLTSTLGAPLISPPLCSRLCLDSSLNGIPRGTCTVRDTACLCSSDLYAFRVTECITDSCRDPVDSQAGIDYWVNTCNDLDGATSSTSITTSSQTSTGTSSTPTDVEVPYTLPAPTTPSFELASSFSSTFSVRTTTTTVPVSITFTTSSGTGASPNGATQESTNQANSQLRLAIIVSAVSVLLLICVLSVILVTMRRRRKLKKEEDVHYSQYTPGEVDSPLATMHPWRATTLTTLTQPDVTTHPTTGYGFSEQPPTYDGPTERHFPENYAPTRESSLTEPPPTALSELPSTGPTHPAPRQQESPSPVDEYYNIGSNFLRGS